MTMMMAVVVLKNNLSEQRQSDSMMIVNCLMHTSHYHICLSVSPFIGALRYLSTYLSSIKYLALSFTISQMELSKFD